MLNEILTFSLIALLLVISPGPNGVLIINTASSVTKSAAILNIIGLTSATFFHGAFSIFGLSALLMQSAELFFIIKVLGGAYLFYIGIKSIIHSFKNTNNDIKSAKISAPKSTALVYFNQGFITQILNPKVSIFYLAAFPQFIPADNFSYTVAFFLVAIHATLIFMWFASMTFAIDKIKYSVKNTHLGTWVQRLSGLAMIYFSSIVLAQK